MRVLILGNVSIYNKDDFGWGGIETTIKAFRKYLTELGHEVKVVHLVLVPYEFEHGMDEKDPDAIYIFKLNPFKKILPVYFVKKELKKIIEKIHPDVIWSRNIQLGLSVSKMSDCPIIQIFPELAKIAYQWDFSKNNYIASTKKGIQENWLKRNAKIFKRLPRYLFESYLEKKALKKLLLVVFSQTMQEQLQKIYDLKEDKIHLIHPGVNREFFNPEKGRLQFKKIETKFGFKESDKFILFVGRLVTGKNIHLLLKAMTLIDFENRLVIVGEGPLKEELERYTNHVGLSSKVIFIGRQDEYLPGLYSMARVLVNPCLLEPFGHVFIESLSCGTPIIGIKSDGNRTITALNEITRNEKYGKIVDSTPEALASAIKEVIGMNDDLYQNQSVKGIEFIDQNYNWKEFVKKMIYLPAR